MLNKKDLIKTSVFLFPMIVWGYAQLHQEYPDGVMATGFFRLLSGNIHLLYQLMFVMGFFLTIVCRYYLMQLNRFDDFILTRIGYRKYYRKSCTAVFLTTAITTFLFHIIIVFLCLHNSDQLFEVWDIEDTILFSTNPFWNVILYVLCSSVGMGLFFLMMYSLSYFIRNKYIFYVLPVCIIFFTLFLFVGISSLSDMLFQGNIEWRRTVVCSITPMNLYTPGMMFEVYGWISFILSSFLYGSIFLVMSKLSWKVRMKHG